MFFPRYLLIAAYVLSAFGQDDRCRILVQPTAYVVAGEVFPVQPKILSVVSPRLDYSSIAQVWVQLGNQKENIGLNGQPFANIVDGVAQFTNLYISAPADDLRLTFNCTNVGLSIDSEPFHVQSSVTRIFVNNSIYIPSAPTGLFVINRVDGVLCEVLLPVQGTPGSSVVPKNCSLTGNVESVSIMLPYLLPNRIYGYTSEDEIDICPAFPNCDVSVNCTMSTTNCPTKRVYPSVALVDSYGSRVSATTLPVTVSLNPLAGSDESPLYGKITNNSCCALLDCEAYGGLCCNCSDPACATCAIPYDGVVTFAGLSAVKVGIYEMIFSAMRKQTSDDGSSTWSILRTTYDVQIQMFPGRSDSLTVDEESTFTATLGHNDESALLVPQPVLEVVDRFKNKGASSVDSESALALPCEDSEYNGEKLCSCTNLTCLRPRNLGSAVEYAVKAFDGQILADCINSKASYTNLRIFLSAPKFRISFWFFRKGALSNRIPAMSRTFSISPGTLSHIILVDQPAFRNGCERCPKGVHLANQSLPVEMILYDIFNNPISFCDSPELACSGIPFSSVAVKACTFAKNGDSEILPSAVQTRAKAKDGIILFTDLRIHLQNNNYSLLFYIIQENGGSEISCNTSQNSSKIVKSLPFAIINNAPARLRAVGFNATSVLQVESVDLEPLPSDVTFEVLDAFGNTVISNCYSVCDKPALESIPCNSHLSALQSACNINISVRPTDTQKSLEVFGTLEELSRNGIVTFTNLALRSALSSTCEINSRSYSLRFDASPANPAYIQVVLRKPVHNITIDIQPAEVSAREAFYPHPQVSSRDCNNYAVNSRNYISVRISQNAGYGTLEGRTLVEMIKGIAIFTDLSIDLTGVNYALEFKYIGLFGNSYDVSSVISNKFDVFLPSPRLEFVPGANLNGSVAVAGIPFAVQPQIKVFIRDEQLDLGSSLDVTVNIGENPGDKQPHDPEHSSLLGKISVKVWNGIAVFTDLGLTKASVGQNIPDNKGYTLIFTFGDVRIESGFIHVVPQNLNSLWIPVNLQPSVAPSEAGLAFTVQPTIFFVDKFNNRVDFSQIPPKAQVGVSVLKDQFYRNTLLQHPGLSEIFLLRDARITNCTGCCKGNRPILCTMPANSNIQETAGEDGVIRFTDLRIDIASDSYRLVFYMINANFVQNATSLPFVVTNTVPSYPKVIQTLADLNIADMPLIRQPIVTVVDRFENTITYDNVPNRTVKVTLHLPSSYWSSITTGQSIGTVCRLLPKDSIFVGTLEVPVDLKRGWGVFTDLFVRQALAGYMLEFAMRTSVGMVYVNTSMFSVQSGTTTGICAVGIPNQCSAGGSCSSYIDVVCVDSFGNINSTCKTRLDSLDGVPLCGGAVNTSCLTVTLRQRASSAIDCVACPAQVGQQCLCSSSLNQVLPCTSKPGGISQWVSYTCKTGMINGRSSFTDLMFYKAGKNYSLVFTTFVRDDWFKLDYMWSTESQLFDVSPTQPSIKSTYVSDSLNELYVRFDRATNMPTIANGNLCSALLEQGFYLSLGQDPKCLWVQPDQLQVTLGKGAFIDETSQVILNKESNIISQEFIDGVLMDSLPATTIEGSIVNGKLITRLFPQLPSIVLAPVPVIIAPSQLTACDLIQADGRLSAGNLGRAFTQLKWGLNYNDSKLDVGILSAAFEPSFDRRVISFSSYLPGEVNDIQVTLRPNAPVLPGTTITLSGLPSLSSCKSMISDPSCLQLYYPSNTQVCCSSSPLYGTGSLFFDGHENIPTIEWLNDTQWVIKVAENSFLSEKNDTVFSFQIINPSFTQRNYVTIESACDDCMCMDDECVQRRSFAFSRIAMQMNCDELCPNPTAAFFEILSPSISLVDGSIFESSNVSGTMNVITVRFKPSDDLPPGSAVIIGGLNGSITRSGYLCLYGSESSRFVQNICNDKGSQAPSAFWNSTTTELRIIVKPGARIFRNETSIFWFRLQNSYLSNRRSCTLQSQQRCESWARANIQFVYPTDLSRTTKKFSLPGDVLGSGGSFRIMASSVNESSSVAGAKNVLTFLIQSNALIPAKTQIRLSGLNHLSWFQDLGTSSIPIYDLSGQPSLCFNNAISQGNDILLSVLVTCYGDVPFVTISPITFSMEVMNEKLRQSPAQLFLSAQYSFSPGSFVINQQRISGLVLESLELARFDNFSIRESNNLVGQRNSVLITFKCSVSLLAGSVIRIWGFMNTFSSIISASHVKILDPQFTTIENPYSFDFTAGMLELTLTNTLLKDIPYTVNILVRNGFVSKPGTGTNLFSIGARARMSSGYFLATLNRSISSDSLLSRGFPRANASITELSRVSRAYNVLTITINTNFDVYGPNTSITVHGLSNSQIPYANITVIDSQNSLSDEMEFYSVFPNCSCSLYEYQSDPECLDPCPPTVAPALPLQARMTAVDSSQDSIVSNVGARWESESQTSFCDRSARSCGRFVFYLKVGRIIPGGDDIVVRFMVLNADAAVLPSYPAVSIQPVQPQYTLSMVGPFLASTPNDLGVMNSKESPRFSSASISFESLVTGYVTKLHVRFQTNCPLLSPGTPVHIHLSGFRGIRTTSGLIPIFGSDSFSVSKSAVADLNSEMGSLSLVGGSITSSKEYSFFFFLVGDAQLMNMSNPLTIKAESTVVAVGPKVLEIIVLGASIQMSGKAYPLASIQILSIAESSALQGVLNTLTVEFVSNIRLFPLSTITFTGFLDSNFDDSDQLPIFGVNASLFGLGSWNRGQGALSFSILPEQEVGAGNICSVSFTIANPTKASNTFVRIETKGEVFFGGRLTEIPVSTFLSSSFRANDSPKFTVAKIKESTTVNGAMNNITILLVANIEFSVGSAFLIETAGNSGNLDLGKRLVVPLSGPSAKIFNFSSQIIDGKLRLPFYHNVAPGNELILSFMARNRICNVTESCDRDMLISYEGGAAAPKVRISNTLLSGRRVGMSITDGGSKLSWIDKYVAQSSAVKNATNKVTFTLRPNAPLFQGSVIVIRGLRGKEVFGCHNCSGEGDRIFGLGCSNICPKCDGVCLPVWNQESQPHDSFVQSVADWNEVKGTMHFTLDRVMDESNPSTFSIFFRNGNNGDNGTECGRNSSLLDITDDSCLTVVLERAILNPAGSDFPPQAQSWNPLDMSVVDSYNVPLMDSCSTCLRPEDLVAFDRAMAVQDSLVLNQVAVFSPSKSHLPVLRAGVPASGLYALSLRLSNWIGLSGESSFLISIASSKAAIRPLVVINSSSSVMIQSHQNLQLIAHGSSSQCGTITKQPELSYMWKLECLDGPCSIMPALESIAPAINQTIVFVRANSLPPGGQYAMKCTVSNSVGSAEAAVTVNVRVRPLVVTLTGISIGGVVSQGKSFTLTAEVYDPEDLVNNVSLQRFLVYWTCNKTSKLYDPPTPCSSNFFSPNNSIAALNTSFFEPDFQYLISLQVSRNNGSLPAAYRTLGSALTSFGQSTLKEIMLSSDCGSLDNFLDCTQVIPGEFSIVSLKLCDVEELGNVDFCKKDAQKLKVSANKKLFLHASSQGDSFTVFSWSVRNNTKDFIPLSGNPLLDMPPSSSWLVLQVGALVSGSKSTAFRVNVLGPNAHLGFATLTLSVSTNPYGGDFTVQPKRGEALETYFSLSALGWSADIEDLPLVYQFFYVDNSGTGFHLSTGAGFGAPTTMPGVNTQLPTGNPQQNYELQVGVTIRNAYDATTTVLTSAFVVMSNGLGVTQTNLLQYLQNLGDDSTYDQLGGAANFVQTLNTISTLCYSITGGYSVNGCSSLSAGREIRAKVLSLLSFEGMIKSVETGDMVFQALHILASTTVFINEIRRPEIQTIMVLLDRYSRLTLSLNIDTSSVAKILCGVVGQLLDWFNKDFSDLSVSRRSTGEMMDILVLMRSISNISSLSTRQALSGMNPVILSSSSSLKMTTFRLSSQGLVGFSAEDIVFGVKVAFAASLISTTYQNIPTDIEIMLVAINHTVSPFPPSMGDILALEIREFGSNVPLAMSLQLPFSAILTIPTIQQSDRWVFDSEAGTKQIPFVVSLDTTSWKWSTSGIQLLRNDNETVTAQTFHLSYFTSLLVTAGCDSVPLSGIILDKCGVCGGDNGTCSGCDGVPNTGRNKNCSGHGLCGVKKCICYPDWHGEECQVFCSKEYSCSGHGVCNPQGQTLCVCNSGWSGIGTFPNTFCAFESGQNESSYLQNKNDSGFSILWLALIISLPSTACVGVCFVWLCIFYPKRKQFLVLRSSLVDPIRKKSEQKKEHHPNSDSVSLYLGEQEHVNTTAKLCHGPSNQQLVSAIASSPLNPLAHAQVERIALRTKVFESAISSSRTVQNYLHGPSQTSLKTSGSHVFDWEENEPPFAEDHLGFEKERSAQPASTWEGILKS